jgi:hypothetical protein
MKGIIVTVGTGLLVMVPSAIGLIGNTSFAQSVPVRVPPQATVLDDSGHEHSARTTESGDDKGGQRGPGTQEPGDDKGGQRGSGNASASDDTVVPQGSGTPSPADDKGGQRSVSTPGATPGAVTDTSSGRGQNGRHGGNTSQSGGGDDGSGHT